MKLIEITFCFLFRLLFSKFYNAVLNDAQIRFNNLTRLLDLLLLLTLNR